MRFGVLTVSDRSSRGERADASGPALVSAIQSYGWQIETTGIVSDDRDSIRQTLIEWSDLGSIDIILTTGGTGFAPRDMTPEATLQVVERLAPGIPEAMRQASLAITRHAMLSRAVAGIRASTLIINLPGSPKAAVENLNTIAPVLEHAVELIRGDANSENHHTSGNL
mgnify:CR=1 FL=1